jgi:CDP-6-deoxy-D-xylo-4-hexulose-3-dehydrase
MVVTDDEELFHILLSLRPHGWTRELPRFNRIEEKQTDGFLDSFRFVLPGYNVRPLEMSGAVGLEQLRKLDRLLAARRRNALHFRSRFAGDDRFFLQEPNGESSWFGFSFIIRQDCATPRESFVASLRKSGIEVRPIVSGNFLRNPVIKRLNHRLAGHDRNADLVHDRGFFVGNHGYDLTAQIDHLHQVLESAR